MTITRANLEVILIKRCGKVLTLVSLDGTTVNGTNADLNDPIGFALRKSGLSVDSITAVSDSDVAGVAGRDPLCCGGSFGAVGSRRSCVLAAAKRATNWRPTLGWNSTAEPST